MKVYLAFTRARHQDPLALQGTVQAEDDEAARELALQRLGPRWLELTLVPESAVHWVMRRGGRPAERGGE